MTPTTTLDDAFARLDEWTGLGPATGGSTSRRQLLSAAHLQLTGTPASAWLATSSPTLATCRVSWASKDLQGETASIAPVIRNLLSGHPMEVAGIALNFGAIRFDRLDSLPCAIEVLASALTTTLAATLADQDANDSPQPTDAAHSRLANELREATGLPAATLGAALGVTREQYQRWLTGRSISDARHGLLRYLHSIVAEGVRVLGQEEFRAWLQTPRYGKPSPAELLHRRRLDEVHQLVSDLAQSVPWEDGDDLPLLWQGEE